MTIFIVMISYQNCSEYDAKNSSNERIVKVPDFTGKENGPGIVIDPIGPNPDPIVDITPVVDPRALVLKSDLTKFKMNNDTYVFGWACLVGKPVSLDVKLFVQNHNGNQQEVAISEPVYSPASQGITDACGTSGNFKFRIKITEEIKNVHGGKKIIVKVYKQSLNFSLHEVQDDNLDNITYHIPYPVNAQWFGYYGTGNYSTSVLHMINGKQTDAQVNESKDHTNFINVAVPNPVDLAEFVHGSNQTERTVLWRTLDANPNMKILLLIGLLRRSATPRSQDPNDYIIGPIGPQAVDPIYYYVEFMKKYRHRVVAFQGLDEPHYFSQRNGFTNHDIRAISQAQEIVYSRVSKLFSEIPISCNYAYILDSEIDLVPQNCKWMSKTPRYGKNFRESDYTSFKAQILQLNQLRNKKHHILLVGDAYLGWDSDISPNINLQNRLDRLNHAHSLIASERNDNDDILIAGYFGFVWNMLDTTNNRQVGLDFIRDQGLPPYQDQRTPMQKTVFNKFLEIGKLITGK